MKTIQGGFIMTNSNSAICVMTNGSTMENGNARLRGKAIEYARKFPDVPELLGKLIAEGGNHAYCIREIGIPGSYKHDGALMTYALLSFPTKNDWQDKSDIDIIAQSCEELTKLADTHHLQNIYFPLPGYGELEEAEVLPVISSRLDDRFILVQSAT